MTNHYRFGDYQRRLGAGHHEVSFNDLKPELETDADGRPIPARQARIKLTAGETYQLVRPYVSVRFMEQVRAVVPLGIGIAAAAGKGGSGLSGFGIVTLASLFPIIGVFLLALYVSFTQTPAEIIEVAQQATAAAQAMQPAWYERTPWQELILGVRAILPLVVFLFLVLRLILKEKLKNKGDIFYGITLTVIGMCIFNLGLTYGLSKLGGDVGALVPAAFTEVPGVEVSPIYIYMWSA